MAATHSGKKRKHSDKKKKKKKVKPQQVTEPTAAAAGSSDVPRKKKRKHVEATTDPEEPTQPAQSQSAPVEKPSEDAPIKASKKGKRKRQSDGLEDVQEPAATEASAAIPAAGDEQPPAAKKKKKRRHKETEGAAGLEASRETASKAASKTPALPDADFLNSLQANLEKRRKEAANGMDAADALENLHVSGDTLEDDPKIIKALSATVHGTQLPPEREALLKDWSISVTAAAEKAQQMGFTLRRGTFSQKDDDKIKECIYILRRRRQLTEAQFQSMLVGTSAGGSRRTFKTRCLEEFRYLLMNAIPDRLLKSTQLHARRLVDDTRRLGGFSKEDDDHILELHALHGNDWAKIGAIMGRAGDDVKFHFRKTLAIERNTGDWLEAEKEKFKAALEKYFEEGKSPAWTAIAGEVGTRTAHQCRGYFTTQPEEERLHGWSKEENLALLKGLKKLNLNDESEIRWAPVMLAPALTNLNSTLVQRQWKQLSRKYIEKHGQPSKFKKLLKGLIAEVKERDAEPRKKRSSKQPKPATEAEGVATFKSTELVETEDDEEDLPEV